MTPEVKKRIQQLLLLHHMLTIEEGNEWYFHTRDPEEWQLYLWTKRN